jgi:hypothetical protein
LDLELQADECQAAADSPGQQGARVAHARYRSG